jgi:hypothetical protein
MTTHRNALEFVASRLDAIPTYPSGWGSADSLEPQVLTLLELRLVLVEPQMDTEAVQARDLDFVGAAVGGPRTLPLAARLESVTAKVVEVLRGFVARERAWQDSPQHGQKTPRSA